MACYPRPPGRLRPSDPAVEARTTRDGRDRTRRTRSSRGRCHARAGQPGRSRRPTRTSTASCRGSSSTRASSTRRATSAIRCSSGSSSWPSSPATSTSSSRSGSPASASRSRPARSPARPTDGPPTSSWRPLAARVLELVADHSAIFVSVRRALAAEGVELRRLRGHPRAPRRPPPALPRRDLPGPDAARGRPGPSVPVHLDAQPVDRGRAARPRDRRARVRAGQGAADPAAPGRGRADALHPPRPGHRGEPRRACSPGWRSRSTTSSGSPATPTSRSRRTRRTTSCWPSRRSSGDGGSGRPSGSRSSARCRPRRAPCSSAASGSARPTATRVSGMLDLTGLYPLADLDRPGPQARALVAGHAAAPHPARRGRAGRRLRRDPRRRHPGPPPVRIVRRVGRAVHHPGRRRSRGPDHQADPLPDVRRLADRPVADPGRRAGQAGRRPGRDQGPLRRGGQHRLGAQAGARRRPRRVRAGRAQDALEDRARRPPRGLRACAATSTSGPATTTRRRPGCTSTSAC